MISEDQRILLDIWGWNGLTISTFTDNDGRGNYPLNIWV
jgi:hypothetical protein